MVVKIRKYKNLCHKKTKQINFVVIHFILIYGPGDCDYRADNEDERPNLQ